MKRRVEAGVLEILIWNWDIFSKYWDELNMGYGLCFKLSNKLKRNKKYRDKRSIFMKYR